jgi:hypothetical protein
MKSTAPPKDPLDSITQEQWIEMWLKLRLHARKRYFWLSQRLGEDLDEIVHQAILDTMNRERQWPPIDARTGEMRKDVNLFSFLCEVVRSKASHLWKREKQRLSIDTSNPAQDTEEFNQEFVDHLLNESAKKYPHLVRLDDTQSNLIYNDVSDKMLDIVAGDPVVYSIVKRWCEEPDLKPKELAARLEILMPKFCAARKRLRRLLKEFREGSSNE